jgi:hypothetical protein
MKKHFNHLFLVTLVTMFMLVGCSKNEPIEQENQIENIDLSDSKYDDPAPGDGGYGDRFIDNTTSWQGDIASDYLKRFITTNNLDIDGVRAYNTYLIGSYNADLKRVITHLRYPYTNGINFNFPVPRGHIFNILNDSKADYDYWTKHGGFFRNVNIPWLNSAIRSHSIIFCITPPTKANLYNKGVLTGYGKEIKYLEDKGLRYFTKFSGSSVASGPQMGTGGGNRPRLTK